jgi:hypothetical protein
VREHSGHPRAAWVIISPSAQRRVGSRAAGKECRPTLSMTGEMAPREACRRHATMKLQYEGPRRTRPGVSGVGLVLTKGGRDGF